MSNLQRFVAGEDPRWSARSTTRSRRWRWSRRVTSRASAARTPIPAWEITTCRDAVQIDAHQHFWRYSPAEYRLDRRLAWRRCGATSCRPMRAARCGAPASTPASPCRRGRPSTKRAGCWRSPTRIRSLPASSAGSICRRRTSSAQLEQCRRPSRSSSACGTSCRASRRRFLLRPAFRRGVALLEEFGLAYDILVYRRHLPAAAEFAGRFRGQRFVLDHLGKPDIRGGEIRGVARGICAAGRASERLVQAVGAGHRSGLGAWTPDSCGRISTSRSTVSAPIA